MTGGALYTAFYRFERERFKLKISAPLIYSIKKPIYDSKDLLNDKLTNANT